jgi:hypothetical protein
MNSPAVYCILTNIFMPNSCPSNAYIRYTIQMEQKPKKVCVRVMLVVFIYQ